MQLDVGRVLKDLFFSQSSDLSGTLWPLTTLVPGARHEDSGSDDEGSLWNDGASATSEASSLAPDNEAEAVDESSKVEEFESKLREALELATQKSAAGRLKALEAICGAFLKRYCPDFIDNQQVLNNIKIKTLSLSLQLKKFSIKIKGLHTYYSDSFTHYNCEF